MIALTDRMHSLGAIVPADMMEPGPLVEHVQWLESLGYRSVWIPDMFGREIYVTAAHLLANTSTITIVSGIAHIYGRDAIASSQAARTLAELSGGRFVQGLGVSHPIAAQMRGLEWENPVAKMRGHLEAMRDTPLQIRAAQPPVYIAAHGPKMLALAAEAADGANTYMQPPSHTARARDVLGPDKTLSVVLPCCLSTDPDAARAAGRRALSIYLPLAAYQRQWAAHGFTEPDWSDGGSDRLIDTYVAWGDVEEVGARIDEHLDAGADQVQISANAPRGGSTRELFESLAGRG
jgi:probable F420-dependent oxidoreductase